MAGNAPLSTHGFSRPEPKALKARPDGDGVDRPVDDLETRLRDSGDWLGSACLSAYRGAGVLYGAAIDDDVLQVSAIGGKVEAGESFAEAAVREFREETGTEFAILPQQSCRRLGDHGEVTAAPPGAAALAVLRPTAHPTGGRLWIAIYLGRAHGTPREVEKVRHFVVHRSGPLTLNHLLLLTGDDLVPAARALPVRRVELVNTPAVLTTVPGLVEDWYLRLRQAGPF